MVPETDLARAPRAAVARLFSWPGLLIPTQKYGFIEPCGGHLFVRRLVTEETSLSAGTSLSGADGVVDI